MATIRLKKKFLVYQQQHQHASRDQEGIPASMQRPPGNTSIHQKTTRKHQCPSKDHQEATISTQGPPRNASIGPETRKQMHWAHMYVTGTP